jgi:hypothetical protein
VRHMFVRFWRAVRSVFQRKTVKGLVQILHSFSRRVSKRFLMMVHLQGWFRGNSSQASSNSLGEEYDLQHHDRTSAFVRSCFQVGSSRRRRGSRWSPILSDSDLA